MRRISMDQRNVGAQHAAPLQRMASPTAPPLHRALGGRIFLAVTTQLTCPSCRAEIPSGSAFCPACGTPSPTVVTTSSPPVPLSVPERGDIGRTTAVPAPALAGVATAQRLARALGAKYEVRRLVGRRGFAGVPAPGEGSSRRQRGVARGTVEYARAEQAIGQPIIAERSELYAFGAMLYQMVAGTPPYDGASSAEIVGKHLADPVPVASEVNAKIPRWLSSVIVKCLAKKPEDRYQSADEVLAALAAGRASGSTGLVGARTLERQVRRSGEIRSRTARLGWWAAGALAVLVGGGVARRAGYLGSGVAFVHNALVEPVEILRDGVPLDTVGPDGTRRLWLSRWRDTGFGWRL